MEQNNEEQVGEVVEMSEDVPASDMPEPSAPAASELDALRSELQEAKAKASEYLDGWQRARAEFSNYRKRQEADLVNLRFLSTGALATKLLPVIDDFERASKTLPPALRDMSWIEGVLLISRKVQLILESEGVKAIDVKPHDAFDPAFHEAVSHDAADGFNSGEVIEELQKGYKLGERVIRPTLVRVAQ